MGRNGVTKQKLFLFLNAFSHRKAIIWKTYNKSHNDSAAVIEYFYNLANEYF